MQLSTECQMKIIVMAFDGTTGSERTQQNGNDNTAGCNSNRSSGIGGGSNIIPINFYVSFICAEHQTTHVVIITMVAFSSEMGTWREKNGFKSNCALFRSVSFHFIYLSLNAFFFISSVVSWFHLKMWREIWKRYQKQKQNTNSTMTSNRDEATAMSKNTEEKKTRMKIRTNMEFITIKFIIVYGKNTIQNDSAPLGKWELVESVPWNITLTANWKLQWNP